MNCSATNVNSNIIYSSLSLFIHKTFSGTSQQTVFAPSFLIVKVVTSVTIVKLFTKLFRSDETAVRYRGAILLLTLF